MLRIITPSLEGPVSTSEAHQPQSGPTPGRRRQLERRDRVYTAAIALFTERGYDGTTMEDIAAHAHVSRGSVFNYFARKSAFLDEWAARRRARAFSTTIGLTMGLSSRLKHLMLVLAEVNVSTRAETVAMSGPAVRELDLLTDSALAAELTHLIKQTPGEIDGFDARLVANVLATGYFAILKAWCVPGPQPFDIAERLTSLVDLTAHGFEPR